MRRYIESAGQHFGMGGYVINIENDDPNDPGAVFGQAWSINTASTMSTTMNPTIQHHTEDTTHLQNHHPQQQQQREYEEGDVDGCDASLSLSSSSLDSFEVWIKGEWIPRTYTNIKPTPIGTAYPEKANVESYAIMTTTTTTTTTGTVQQEQQQNYHHHMRSDFKQFTMVRGDEPAKILSEETQEIRAVLSSAMTNKDEWKEKKTNPTVVIGSWPSRSC